MYEYINQNKTLNLINVEHKLYNNNNNNNTYKLQ